MSSQPPEPFPHLVARSAQRESEEGMTDPVKDQPSVIHVPANPDCPSCHNLQGTWDYESSDIASTVLDRSWGIWCDTVSSYRCSKCIILMVGLRQFPPPGGLTCKRETVVRVRYRRRARNCLEFGFHNLSKETHFHDDGNDASREHILEIYVDAIPAPEESIGDDPEMDDDHNALPTFRSVTSNAGSPEALKIVKSWISECQATHDLCCDVKKHRFLPTRLIDVGGDDLDRVKLVDGAGMQSEYVALSYCWGRGLGGAETTQANVDDHKTSGLLIDELPATIRDAVCLTQKLGYRYLWVDRLCVIQGDAKDWATEAGRMCDVYADAVLTISADSSASVWDGLLHDQGYATTVGQNDINVASNIIRKKDPHTTFTARRIQRSMPTYRRAWTLQEQFLSRRVLHYTENEMVWECFERRCCECRRDSGPSDRGYSPRQHSDVQHIYHDWAEIVHEYTTRALTNESDKLPAVSGLAARVSELIEQTTGRSDTYLAGLWKADLAAGLCWLPPTREDRDAWLRNNRGPEPSTMMSKTESEADSEVELIFRFTQALQRKPANFDERKPKVYTAPTWSWASVNGPASYSKDPMKDSFRGAVEIIAAETTSAVHANPFGQVSDGRITLRGPIVHGLTLERGQQIYARDVGTMEIVPSFQLADFRDDNIIDVQPDDPNEVSRYDPSGERKSNFYKVSCLMIGHRRMAVDPNLDLQEPARSEMELHTRVGTKEYEEMEDPPEFRGDAGRQIVWDMCQSLDGWEHEEVFWVDLGSDDGSRPHFVPFSFSSSLLLCQISLGCMSDWLA